MLSPIILVANQLFNFLTSDTLPLDEIELSQSGPFLLGLALFLIVLAHAVEKQKKIQAIFGNWYARVEARLQQRLQQKEALIQNTRKQLDDQKMTTKDLQHIRSQLETELKK